MTFPSNSNLYLLVHWNYRTRDIIFDYEQQEIGKAEVSRLRKISQRDLFWIRRLQQLNG